MHTVNTQSYKARVQAVLATASFAKEIHVSRSKKLQTIAAARKSVATKLRLNAAYFLDNSLKKPDLVYKQQSSDLYAVSIKYCNIFLAGVFDGDTWCNVQAASVPQVLELFATDAEAGIYDAHIQAIMDAKRASRNKTQQ
jgi:hypothetical protein